LSNILRLCRLRLDEHIEKPVGKGYSGYYLKNRAYFTKKGLTKRIILHELYHHSIDSRNCELSIREEEKEANHYSRGFPRI
jgi:hypothetical protein